jgi:fluoride exporter
VIWVGVALLGGLGAVLRHLVAELVPSARFPLGILAVNVSGSLALGVVSGLALSGDALLLAATALIGSYTTFSTWMLDTARLPLALAALNVGGSLAAGVAAVALGRALAG